jgi:hydroxyethylthiazole kinase-like uncharacterized protein yjeF
MAQANLNEGSVVNVLANGPDVLSQVVVTTQQMQQIEAALFEAGMPVAALMEKVAGRITNWIVEHYPCDRTPTVGFIIGPGHNGGDALVVARELHHRGYQVRLWCPFSKLKELTAQHKAYAEFLGIRCTSTREALESSDFIVDGGFGFGLTRSLTGDFADSITAINHWHRPIISIDLPSGLATDTGEVLGVAIRARHTLCLGLWKLGLLQDPALPWTGESHLLPFDIPPSAIAATLTETPPLQRLSAKAAIAALPLPRSPIAHKYKAGHALLVAGSHRYAGAALLAGQGALASGVGMLTLVVPASLKLAVSSQLPEALVMAAPETTEGIMAGLPDALDISQYDCVACGPGMTPQTAPVMEVIVRCDRPLIVDADGLNWLSQHEPQSLLPSRSAPTLLTPHPGEFRRLFPDIWQTATTAATAAQLAAQATNATLILKGAVSAIAHSNGRVWLNAESTPALARGGSGDVLTGLIAGLAAQHCQRTPHNPDNLLLAALSSVWWHAQTGRHLAANKTVLGGSPTQLAAHLLPTLAQYL